MLHECSYNFICISHIILLCVHIYIHGGSLTLSPPCKLKVIITHAHTHARTHTHTHTHTYNDVMISNSFPTQDSILHTCVHYIKYTYTYIKYTRACVCVEYACVCVCACMSVWVI